MYETEQKHIIIHHWYNLRSEVIHTKAETQNYSQMVFENRANATSRMRIKTWDDEEAHCDRTGSVPQIARPGNPTKKCLTELNQNHQPVNN